MSRVTALNVLRLLSDADYILLDIDGVLWSGDHVLPGAVETLEWLRVSMRKRLRFISNNSTMTRYETQQKFAKRGFSGVSVDEIFTSGYAAALHLRGKENAIHDNIFVIGQVGLHDELKAAMAPGFSTYGLELNGLPFVQSEAAHCVSQRMLPAPGGRGEKISLDELDCGVVVCGLDMNISMLKIACAALCVQRRDRLVQDGRPRARYIATNEDPQLPMGDEGYLFPGAGSIVNCLSTVLGRGPDTVCGKPNQMMAQILFEAEGITDPSRCLMIGDRLSTDISFGNRAGCKTLLVLSGIEGLADVEESQRRGAKEMVPHYIAESIADLWSLSTGSSKL